MQFTTEPPAPYLEISMKNSSFMQIMQSQSSLEKVHKGLLFTQLLFVPEVGKQCSIFRIFQNDIHIILILKAMIQLNNVRMTESFMNFDLSSH